MKTITTITATEVKLISKAVEIVSAQGFNTVNVETITDKPFVYKVLCFYGDTEELYILTVDAIKGTYVSSERKGLIKV